MYLHRAQGGKLQRFDSSLNPAAWDKIKDQLTEEDKRAFLDLYSLATEDPLLQCRKAEVHISLGTEADDNEAFLLLEHNPLFLARALIMQLRAAQGKREEVKRFCPSEIPEAKSILDIEASCHVFRWAAWLAFVENRFEEAESFNLKADAVAESLGLSYMRKVLAADLADIRQQLGKENADPDSGSGNVRLIQSRMLSAFRKYLLEQGEAEFPHELKLLARSVQSFQQGRFYDALSFIHGLKFQENELAFYLACLRLELFARLGEAPYTEPRVSWDFLNQVALEYEFEVHQLVAKVFPLAALLLELKVNIPLLKDGLLYLGNKEIKLPYQVIAGLEVGSFENVPPYAVSRARKKLAANGLEFQNLVTQTLYIEAKAKLEQVIS